METENLEKKIKEFAAISDKLDERYRVKCFEVLLTEYLRKLRVVSTVPEKVVPTKETENLVTAQKSVVPIGVRALFQQYDIQEDVIPKLFVTQEGEVQPAYQLKTTKMAEAQTQLALLTALENALKPGGKFEFATEVVRQKCKDHGTYDQPNFKTIFKNNSKLFKSLKDEEHVELSVDGKAELADVILAVTK